MATYIGTIGALCIHTRNNLFTLNFFAGIMPATEIALLRAAPSCDAGAGSAAVRSMRLQRRFAAYVMYAYIYIYIYVGAIVLKHIAPTSSGQAIYVYHTYA